MKQGGETRLVLLMSASERGRSAQLFKVADDEAFFGGRFFGHAVAFELPYGAECPCTWRDGLQVRHGRERAVFFSVPVLLRRFSAYPEERKADTLPNPKGNLFAGEAERHGFGGLFLKTEQGAVKEPFRLERNGRFRACPEAARMEWFGFMVLMGSGMRKQRSATGNRGRVSRVATGAAKRRRSLFPAAVSGVPPHKEAGTEKHRTFSFSDSCGRGRGVLSATCRFPQPMVAERA